MKKDTLIRLNKFLAHANIGTRRECDKYIVAGLITVNENIVDKTGVKININDTVTFKGNVVQGAKAAIILIKKGQNKTTIDKTTDNKKLKAGTYLMNVVAAGKTARVVFVAKSLY